MRSGDFAVRVCDALEAWVEKKLEEQTPTVDVDNVEGLERFVESVIEGQLEGLDADNIANLDDAVRKEVRLYLTEEVRLADFLDSEDFVTKDQLGALVAQEVRKTLTALFTALMAGLVPIAQPAPPVTPESPK